MNASLTTPASASASHRRHVTPAFFALAIASLASLQLMLADGAWADRPAASAAANALVKSRFDRLSMHGVHSGVLVTGSVLPGSKHVKGRVSLLLRSGNQGAFKKVQTVKLATNDRNFAFLDHVAPGPYSVKVRFEDPSQVVTTTSRPKQITVLPVSGNPMNPGSVKVSSGSVTYSGSIPHPKSATQIALLGLDVGPIAGATNGSPHTPARTLKVLATTTAPASTGTSGFTLQANLKRGQRWALVLQRSAVQFGVIDYAGLKTVRVS